MRCNSNKGLGFKIEKLTFNNKINLKDERIKGKWTKSETKICVKGGGGRGGVVTIWYCMRFQSVQRIGVV